MNDDINEINRRKEKLIESFNKLIRVMILTKNPDEVEKLDSIITRILKELEVL